MSDISNGDAGRMCRRCITLPLACIGALLLLVAGCAESLDNDAADLNAAESVSSHATFSGYTDQEIGTDYLVDSYFASKGSMSLTRYRTDEEYLEASVADDRDSLDAEDRDRARFEQTVKLLLFAAGEVMPPAVESASYALRDAFYESLDLCAVRSQWPDVELYRYEDGEYFPAWSPQEEADRLGVSLDEYLDFRHECNKFAASYPSLESKHRDELLKTRREYYLEVLRLWMRDHPEMVVPMTPEQSTNHPYQEYVRSICMASEDPQACARSEGVPFP